MRNKLARLAGILTVALVAALLTGAGVTAASVPQDRPARQHALANNSGPQAATTTGAASGTTTV
jgi:hypothetical protein